MKYLLILLLISNDCLGQIRYIGTTIKIDTIRPVYSPFRDTIIAGTGVIILDTFVNGRHCYIFTIDTSYQIPKVNFNEYELGDEGGKAKVFNNYLHVDSSYLASPEYYKWRKKKDTMPTAKLSIKNATTGVGLQKPLKFSSGTIPVLKESGAIDYDSTYISPSKYYYQPKKDTIPKDTVHTKGLDYFTYYWNKKDTTKGVGFKTSDNFYKDGDSIKGGSGTLRFTSELDRKSKVDTLPCYLLISSKEEFDYSVVSNVEAIRGFVVRDNWWVKDAVYLDDKRNPLDKNIVVWICKPEK